MLILNLIYLFILQAAQAGFVHPFTEEKMVTNYSHAVVAPTQQKANAAAAATHPHSRITMPATVAPVMNVRQLVKSALTMPLPKRVYPVSNRAKIIQAKYASALKIQSYRSPRTPLTIHIQSIEKLFEVGPIALLQLQERRLQALFLVYDKSLLEGAAELLAIARTSISSRTSKMRDFLFSGIATIRSGLPYAAAASWQQSVRQGAWMDSYYWQILQGQSKTLPVPLLRRLLTKELYLSPEEQLLAKAMQIKNATVFDTLISQSQTKTADIAKLQTAHLLAQQGEYQKAQHLLSEIHNKRAYLLDWLVERASLDYANKNYARSLGTSIALQSDFFKQGFVPEALIIEASSRLGLCDFGGAENALKKLQGTYSVELQSVEDLLAKKLDDQQLYVHAVQLSFATPSLRFAKKLASLPIIQDYQSVVYGWKQESVQLPPLSAKQQNSEHAATMRAWKDWLEHAREQNNSFTYARGGQLLVQALEKQKNQLHEILAQAELLKLDIAAKASHEIRLQTALNFPAREPASPADPFPQKNDWGFNQETWEDELDSLVYQRPSRCAAANVDG